MPTVSVIIPVYNVEKFIRASLDSLLAQTFNDFEVLCVNDGSPDNCGNILAEYAKNDPRIKIITQENQGVSAARNAALDKMSGEYVAFFDPDDLMHPQFLELMVGKIKKAKADIICCEYTKIEEDCVMEQYPQLNDIDCALIPSHFEKFSKRQKPHPKVTLWNKIYKADIIKLLKFETIVHTAEDVIFMHSALYNAQSVYYTAEPLIYYRQRKGSNVNSDLKDRYIEDHIEATKLLMVRFKDKKMSKEARKALEYRFAKILCKSCIALPYKKSSKKRYVFWNKYSDIMSELLKNGIYHPEVLDIRNRFLTYLFIRKKFKLLNFILRF